MQVDLHLLDIKTGSETSPWLRPDWVLNVPDALKERLESGETLPESSTSDKTQLCALTNRCIADQLSEMLTARCNQHSHLPRSDATTARFVNGQLYQVWCLLCVAAAACATHIAIKMPTRGL